MESSKNDSDAQKSFHSPPRRRRSAFFEKRDSLFASQPDTENNDPNVKLNEVDKKHHNDSQRYHDILLAEKNEWKAEVKSRQKQYRDIKEQYLISQKDQKSKRRRIISYSMLSNEDIEFLEQKPNISQLVESQENLHKSVLQTQEFYRRALELDNVILDHCKKKLCKVNDYIMQNSTVDSEE